MGGSFVLFAVSLCGVAALFVCKYLEVERRMRTPLTKLRRTGDPFFAEGLVLWRERIRRSVREFSSVSVLFCREAWHGAATRLHAALHSVSVRFGEYLKRRGPSASMRAGAYLEKGDSGTSTYVKNMLEYKKEQENYRDNPRGNQRGKPAGHDANQDADAPGRGDSNGARSADR